MKNLIAIICKAIIIRACPRARDADLGYYILYLSE